MTCPFASDMSDYWAWQDAGRGPAGEFVFPHLLASHMSEGGARPLSVYECYGDVLRCPGGPPGTCAVGRRGINCGECKEGLAPGPEGTCQECEGGDTVPFVIFCVLLLAAAVGAYR